MANLRELASDSRYETVNIKATLIPFPVRFDFPDELRDVTSRTVIKSVHGVRVLCFYTPPVPNDVIEFRGYLFKVSGRFHEDVKVKGSPQKDRMPIIVTEYFGKSE